jgi:hypothetical protein
MAARKASPQKQIRRKAAKSASHATLKVAAGLASDRVLYLYALTPASAPVTAIATFGIDGVGPVRSIACGDFCAWISEVPRAEFGAGIEQRMEDLDWLANASVRHQRVVAELAQRATVLPARFGTIFMQKDSLCDDVAAHARELHAALQHVSGADEWGIKVFRVQSGTAAAAQAASGADYLQQKAARLRQQTRTSGELPAEVAELATGLRKLVRDSGPGGNVSRGQPGLAWQASLLLPRANKKQFDSMVRRFAAANAGALRIEVTGPWPPYSFVKHGS